MTTFFDGENTPNALLEQVRAFATALAPMYGDGPPSADLGLVGSYYRDISDEANPVDYGPKTEAGWGVGRSVVGPAGERGRIGYANLAELKDASPNEIGYIVPSKYGPISYAFVEGNFTGKADDRYYVKLNSVPLNVGALVRDTSVVDIRDFGAIGDGIADDTNAIQAAIDFIAAQPNGGVVTIPPGTFRLTYRQVASIPGVFSLILKDKVILNGMSKHSSILRLTNNAIGPGTYGRIIISDSAYRISHAGLTNLTVDGNRNGQGLYKEQGNGGNVLIGNCEALTVTGIVSKGANGQGIQVIGSRDNTNKNLMICDNEVYDTAGSSVNADGSIALEYNGNGCGIQVTYADRYLIANNIISETKDNCIDTYNENVDYSTVPPTIYEDPVGGRGVIANNVLANGRVGIFPETSARVRVSDNYIHNMVDAGVAINRINSAPSGVVVDSNTITNCSVGIRVGGDCAGNPGVILSNNLITNVMTGGGCGILLDRTSYVLIEGNTFAAINATGSLIRAQGSQVVFIRITGNRYYGNPPLGTLFYNIAASSFQISVDDWLSVDGLSDNREDNMFSRAMARFPSLTTKTLAFVDATTSTAAPSAGAAAALPATPEGYLTINVQGVDRRVPYY